MVVTGLGHGAGGLSLRREGLGTAIEKRFTGEREIEIGDPSFDDEYYVQGHAPSPSRSWSPGRAAGSPACCGGASRSRAGSPSRWTRPWPTASSRCASRRAGSPEAASTFPRSSPGARRGAPVVAPKDVAGHIAANVGREGEAGARLQALLMLAREFRQHPATRTALLAARKDRSEEVRCARRWRSARRGGTRSSIS